VDFLLGFGQNQNLKLASKQLDDIPFKATPLRLTTSSIIKVQHLKRLIPLIKEFKPNVIVLQFHVAVISYWRMFFILKDIKFHT
jgi:hypothetical protein